MSDLLEADVQRTLNELDYSACKGLLMTCDRQEHTAPKLFQRMRHLLQNAISGNEPPRLCPAEWHSSEVRQGLAAITMLDQVMAGAPDRFRRAKEFVKAVRDCIIAEFAAQKACSNA